jgi:dynein heavy chain
MWCRDVTEVLEADFDRLEAMKDFEQKSYRDLNQLACIVRGDLDKLARAILCALITIDVHARDMITEMVKLGVSALDIC